MSELMLRLPKTLRQNLEILAKKEEVPLTQYIVYILSRQVLGGYTVQVVPKEDAAKQEASFDALLKQWGRISASEADRILNERDPAKPEEGLTPELIRSLKKRIAQSKSGRE
ncbi:MAG: toxin-antitoxin system HicB family antitoxin [Candidatus Electrothrix sp. LOE2]|nr:toxin-antitoxin system HicB family antitoxin [Candidatus Electrothrix sp. LOE2]